MNLTTFTERFYPELNTPERMSLRFWLLDFLPRHGITEPDQMWKACMSPTFMIDVLTNVVQDELTLHKVLYEFYKNVPVPDGNKRPMMDDYLKQYETRSLAWAAQHKSAERVHAWLRGETRRPADNDLRNTERIGAISLWAEKAGGDYSCHEARAMRLFMVYIIRYQFSPWYMERWSENQDAKERDDATD